MDKNKKLADLRAEIINDVFIKNWKEVWFYPEFNGVRGWQGTGDVIFLGLNPATAVFGGFYDSLYYESLKKFGFENAHLTDIFKVKETNKDAHGLVGNKELLRKSKGYLAKEINIIKPKLIVLLGKHVEKTYKMILPEVKIDTITIGHYSYRYGSRAALRKRWFKEVSKMSKMIL